MVTASLLLATALCVGHACLPDVACNLVSAYYCAACMTAILRAVYLPTAFCFAFTTAPCCMLHISWCHNSSHLSADTSDLLLFLGSRKGYSQLVSLPASVLDGQPKATDDSEHTAADGTQSAAQSSESVQSTASVCVRQPAVLDSLAPIHDSFAFQEPKGELSHAACCCADALVCSAALAAAS